MAKIPVSDAVRIIPRDTDFLNRRFGSRGEVFYDRATNTLRLYDGTVSGGIALLRADLENIDGVIGAALGETPPADVEAGTIWFNTANGRLFILYNDGDSLQWVQPTTPSYGSGGGGASSLNGLTDVVVTSPSTGQVLKYNGSNWINDTDATGGGGGNIEDLDNVSVSSPTNGQVLKYDGSNWVNGTDNTSAGSVSLDALSDVAITTPSTNQFLRYNGTEWTNQTFSSGVSNFIGLAESSTSGLTIDRFYLPAITMLSVTNNGALAYRFDQYGNTDNPTIYAINSTTIAFNLNVSGHPFQIQNGAGVNYNTGLVHVATDGTVSTGSDAQGKTAGTLYWKIPDSISGGYRYQCSAHGAMVGSITIKAFSTI